VTVNKKRVELLAQALESGDYEQCTGRLRSWYYGEGDRTVYSYCAEGVAIRVALDNDATLREDWDTRNWCIEHPSMKIKEWYGFPVLSYIRIDTGDGPQPIAAVNDAGTDFWTIAQHLRATYLKEES
jgi:hypothetical protein